jgi:pimeloyl-ACP methyl ester carboxylesterase
MLTAETVQAEGARYTACLVLVPGLWAGARVWRRFATYLAHRGWECRLLELRGVQAGLRERAAAVAAYAAALPARAVLVGHDAGALAALAAAHGAGAAALVLIAPLVPGGRDTRALARQARSLLALVRGRPVPPPAADRMALLWGEGPAAADVVAALGPEDARAVRDVVWGRVSAVPAPGVPTLLLAGERDPLLPPAAARALAEALGAEHRVLAGEGHWPLVGPSWATAVGFVHRWLVQRLGESLLELHAEAMAERAADDADEE